MSGARLVNAVALALGVGALLVARPVLCDVDVEIAPPAKLQGSLDDSEVETIRFFASDGATLAAKLVTKKKARIDVALRLFDPEDVEVAIPAANAKDKGSAIKLKKLVLGRTGTWSLRVSGDRPGDYKLAVKTGLPKKLKFDVDLGAEPAELTIPAPRGATLKITAKALRGSEASPVLQALGGMDVSEEGKRKDGSHKVTVVADASGDLTLRLVSSAGEGPVSVTVAIKPPKPASRGTQDISGDALGRPAGGETVVGRVIDPEVGGRLEAGPASDIVGASFDIPPGALVDPALISLSSTTPAPVGDPDTVSAGPTVQLQSQSLEFGVPISASVPIDSSQAPVQATADDYRVSQLDDEGNETIIAPDSVDVDAGTLAFQFGGEIAAKAAQPSRLRFTAVAPAGSPPLAGRSYWGFAFDANLEIDGSGRDESGLRHASRFEGRLDFDPNGTDWTVTGNDRELLFGLQRGQGELLESVLEASSGSGSQTGAWIYDEDGQRVILTNQTDPDVDQLFVSRDGSILLNSIAEPPEAQAQDVLLDVFVERPNVTDPTALMVGAFHMGELNFAVNDEGGAGLSLSFLSTFGTLTFKPNGSLSVDVTHAEAFATDDVFGNIFAFEESRDRGNTTWTVDPSGDFAGSVLIDDGDGGEIRIFPHRDGRMFVGLQRSSPEEQWAFFVGVRKSSGGSLADLDGTHAVGTCFLEPREYEIEDGQSGSGQVRFVPDFDLSSESSRLIFDGAGGVTLSPRSAIFQERDTSSSGGVREDLQIGSPQEFQYSLAKDGKFAIRAGEEELRGGVTADGSSGFVVQDPNSPTFGIVIFVDLPPNQTQ